MHRALHATRLRFWEALVTLAPGSADHRSSLRMLCSAILLIAAGCATSNYQYSHFSTASPAELQQTCLLIEQGGPDKTLDTMAYVVETPQRVLPFLPNIKRHELSPESTEK